jgi:DMSO/TMAO reductase YedYZ molybdopterin-dependent catalytic subunit
MSSGTIQHPTPANLPGESRDQGGQQPWHGLAAGAFAAIVALAVVVVLKETTGIVSLLDALAEVTLSWLPLGLFSALLRIFGTSAKAWLFVGIAAALILIGAGVGRLFARTIGDPPGLAWKTGLRYGVVTLAALAIFMIWAVDLRVGSVLTYTRLAEVILCVAVAAFAFGLALPTSLWLLRDLAASDPADRPAADQSRRRLLETAALGLTGIASLAILGREVARVRSGEAVVASGGKLPDPITPNDQFYVVSKNFVDPRVDTGDQNWSIRVEGLVQNPRSFAAADLRALAGPDFVSTLTCISNPIGGPLISTATWSGAPLARVLDQTGLSPEATTVVFYGTDGYSDSLPLAKATAPTTTLVWAMNGDPLSRRHGFPARLIVPGRYGIKNVKWLERIKVVSGDYEGYWQQKGWTNVGEVKTESQIKVPGDKAIVHATSAELAGLAFAGDRGIGKVEVSLDGGDTWQTATIDANPSPQSLSWVLWHLPWQPTPGTHTLVVRATDGTGALQTSAHAPTLPDGASGWHHIVVGVVA